MARSYTGGTSRGYHPAVAPAAKTYRGHIGRRVSLRDLEAVFLKHVDDHVSMFVDTIAEADGIQFLCPKCYTANGGPIGTHLVRCWFVGHVPDDVDPKPGRWIAGGAGIDDLTFTGPQAASIQLTGGCSWHGFVKSGGVTSDR